MSADNSNSLLLTLSHADGKALQLELHYIIDRIDQTIHRSKDQDMHLKIRKEIFERIKDMLDLALLKN